MFWYWKKKFVGLILPIPIHCRTSLGKPDGALYACRTILSNENESSQIDPSSNDNEFSQIDPSGLYFESQSRAALIRSNGTVSLGKMTFFVLREGKTPSGRSVVVATSSGKKRAWRVLDRKGNCRSLASQTIAGGRKRQCWCLSYWTNKPDETWRRQSTESFLRMSILTSFVVSRVDCKACA